MITFPSAKINLGLNITGKRPDGLHNIETVMFPVSLCDILEIVPSAQPSFQFHSSGLIIGGEPHENLCVRAYQLMKEAVILPEVSIHLHKIIPSGAGMGGGSADGAFTLSMLNTMFQTGLSGERLMAMASVLGNDCPFFLTNQPCYATGSGTRLKTIPLDLSAYHVLIVKPECAVNTAWAYGRVKGFGDHEDPLEVVRKPVSTWRGQLVNDFEEIVFEQFPEIGHIKEGLYEMGAVYASMSGSGSSVYGIFDHPVAASERAFLNCFIWSGPMGKFSGAELQ